MSSRFLRTALNKSLVTNVLATAILIASYAVTDPKCQEILRNIGIFALSAALTNWIAIYMLFEKVPFLYGSGIIPVRFKEFKSGLRTLVLKEFFTQDGIKMAVSQPNLAPEKWHALADSLNYDKIYEALVDGIMQSSFGKMLSMFGGSKAVEPLREPLQERLHGAVTQMLSDEALQKQIVEKIQGESSEGSFFSKIEKIVDDRLEMLTPAMVKEIIQKMIREHLGWLVVWGGVFGGLIGLTASFI